MANFTPQQIEEFLQEFFDVVGARQYVGARYVPIFGRAGSDTIEWDDTEPYEPLTVVMHQGVSYVSRRYVPRGIQITDAAYWAQTYRFNAQVEAYRQEVLSFQGQIDALDATMHDDFVPFPDATQLPKYGEAGQVLGTLGDGTTQWQDPVTPSDEQAEAIITAWLDEHPEATTTVLDGAVTTPKIADGAVTDAKLKQEGGMLSQFVLSSGNYGYESLYPEIHFGQYFDTGSATIDVDTYTNYLRPNAAYGWALMSVGVGERYHLMMRAGSGAQGYVLLDASGNKVEARTNQTVPERYDFYVPAGVTHMILNVNTNFDWYAYRVEPTRDADAQAYGSLVDGWLSNQAYAITQAHRLYRPNAVSGFRCAVLRVEAGDRVVYSGSNLTADDPGATTVYKPWAFFDSTGTLISYAANGHYVNHEIVVPDGCRFLVLQQYSFHGWLPCYVGEVPPAVARDEFDTLMQGVTSTPELEQGGFLANGRNNDSSSDTFAKRVRTTGFLAGRLNVTVDCASGIEFSVSFYREPDYTEARVSFTSVWLYPGDTVTIPEDTPYFRLLFRKTGNEDMVPSDVSGLVVTTQGVYDAVRGSVIARTSNYALGPEQIPMYVSVRRLGQLKYKQAFCRYADHYFCTDGANVAKFDLDFTEVADVPLTLGHGNSMQLGNLHENWAYVSGWDDDTVYAVNLDTLAIEETYTLPTTGYTTAAVDDLNGIMYVFQRDTTPSTAAYYDLVTYDYVNETVLSTRRLYRKFGAMQSVDYVEGRIYVLNGLGLPLQDYFLVYDTIGNVIGEYVLGEYVTYEPEGVFLDRVTHELLVSFSDRYVYRIEGNNVG